MFFAIYLSLAAASAGALLAICGALIAAFARNRIKLLRHNRLERTALFCSIGLAVLATTLLMVLPFYAGVSSTSTITVGPDGFSQVVSESNRSWFSRTLVGVNGPVVVVLIAAPILIAGLPLLFSRLRMRPAIEGCCALLLGGQALMGMSGYGVFFGPSALVMVTASVFALNSRNDV